MRYIFMWLALTGCSQKSFDGSCENSINASFQVKNVQLDMSEVPLEYRACVQDSVDAWNVHIPNRKIDLGHYPESSFKFVWNADDLKDAEQGRTEIRWKNGYIYKSTIKISSKYKLSVDYPNLYEVDCRSLIVHEVGHFLSVNHIQDPASSMNPYLSEGTVRRDIKPAEAQAAACLYGR